MTGPEWADRFWAKVDKNGPIPARRPDLGPCWLWTASIHKRTKENTIRHHGKRQCRACDNAAQRRRHASRKAAA